MRQRLPLALIVLLIFILQFNAKAQRYTVDDFYKVDSLAAKALPKDALALVDKLYNQAKAEQNSQLLIKSVIYKMLFQSYLEENAFDKIITDLKKETLVAKQPEKSVLQSLLAETYKKYLEENMYKISSRTYVQGQTDHDFKTWSVRTLTEEIIKNYLSSLSPTQLLQNTKIDIYDAILIGDKTSRVFRPTLYDFLAHRAIDGFVDTRLSMTYINTTNLDFSDTNWFADRDRFVRQTFNQTDSTSFQSATLRLFQQLIQFHLSRNQPSPLADVDFKRLKFIYQRANTPQAAIEYFKALDLLKDKSTNTPVYSDILVEQALLYKETKINIDSPKLNLVKAMSLAKQAAEAYPKSMGAENAIRMMENIKDRELTIKLKAQLQANTAALLHFTYKNIDTIHLKLYKQSVLDNSFDRLSKKEEFIKYLSRKHLIKEWMVVVPKSSDYQSHTLIDQLSPLEQGGYLLIGKHVKLGADSPLYSSTRFNVSNLSVQHRINAQGLKEFLITDLKTGAPIKDVKIQQYRNMSQNAASPIITTDYMGIALGETLQYNYALIHKNKDSIFYAVSDYRYRPQQEDRKVILFTDRAIYRPGQTIFYKGLLISNETGSKNTILPDHGVDLTFEDANGKDIQEVTHQTNEFGTFQGTFTIPTGKMNGRMTLFTIYGSMAIQVEEYKRPSFEIVFEQPKKRHLLNDSVTIQGKALALSGYPVNDAAIKYIVYRRAAYPHNDPMDVARKQVAIGTTKTKAGGTFNITFLALAEHTDRTYQFEIEATVTDLNGETRTNTTRLHIANRDINLAVGLPTALFLSKKLDSIRFSIRNLNNEKIKGKITASWAMLKNPGRLVNQKDFTAENYALNKQDFAKVFPNEAYQNEGEVQHWDVDHIAFTQTETTSNGDGAFKFDQAEVKPGHYRVKFTAENAAKDTLSIERIVVIYGTEASVIQNYTQWLVPESTWVEPGQDAVFRIAGLSSNSNGFYEIYHREKMVERVWIDLSPKQKFIRIKARPEFDQTFGVQFNMTVNGTNYNSLQLVQIQDPSKQLDVKFLSFRDKLQPGEKEQWKLQIASRTGEKQMAEMVATLYDASLDALQPTNWNANINNYYSYFENSWKSKSNVKAQSQYQWYLQNYRTYFSTKIREYENLNLFGYNYYGTYNYGYHSYLNKVSQQHGNSEAARKKLAQLEKGNLYYGLVLDEAGFAIPGAIVKNGKQSTTTNYFGIYSIQANPGDQLECNFIGFKSIKLKVGQKRRVDYVLKPDGSALNEVVVVGYGQSQRKEIAGSVSTIRANELSEQSVKRIDAKAAVAVDAASPKKSETEAFKTNASIVPRTNFSETAFFYPQLRTDEQGLIHIEFTIPQSLTRYKMMGFAHTKDLKHTLVTKELITQKQLAIAANAPRFFREGDTVLFSAKLNNLAGNALKGMASLELRNALNGQLIQIQTPDTKLTQPFSLANEGNQVVKWKLVIPSGIGALTYKLIGEAGRYTDGEEMTIPVLPNRMLVTETLPMNVRGNTTKNFTLEKLATATSKTLSHQSLTLEFTANPIWYAVQALPYLMEYPYDCAEQVFSRFYANSFAGGIINSNPKIKDVFEQWKQTKNGTALLSNLEKNEELKSILLEETPWLRQANNESERKKRLALLFDLNRMTYELKTNAEKLEKMQDPNGSFPWFNGMPGNRYITQHIVLGMGQLGKAGLINEKSFPNYKTILNKAIIYLDNELVNDFKLEKDHGSVAYLPLHYLFARSYQIQKNTNPAFDKAFQYYLKKLGSTWQKTSTYQQAQAALVLSRAGYAQEAKKIINLLKQTAQQSDEMGMYWKDNQNGWWWYQNAIETQAILIEAFDEVTKDEKAVEEMKIWLLKNKQTNDWKTTKATAAACYALLTRGLNLLDENAEPDITVGGQPLAKFAKTDEPKEAGTGYQKVRIEGGQVTSEMAKVTIKNNNKSIAWGGLYWQYFEQLDKITPAATGVRIKKDLFKQQSSAKGEVLTEISANNKLEVGDLLKVRIQIVVDRDMEYVHLKDMRSSGLEPVNVISRFKYQDGLGYYESTKDASTNFFISYLRKGTYVFEYPLRVTHSGNFSNGITTLQCMYAPEFSTHSEGIRITVK